MARKLIVEIVGDASSLEKSYAKAGASTRAFSKEIEHAGRGAISGSGAFKGFARSLAFASGGFVAFAGGTAILKDTINAAQDAAVAQRELAAQMKAAGESFGANREQIEKSATAMEKFGFNNDQVIQGLTVLERGTGSISKSLKLLQLTADIARAKNIGFSASASIVAKALSGQETALRRAVPGLDKAAHGWDLVGEAQAKMAGQAAAATTPSEKFAATLHNTEEIIGKALLPTLNKYLTSLTNWLQKMNESGRLQKDMAAAMDVVKSAADAVKGAFDVLNTVTGNTKNTLKLLFTALVAFKTLQLASKLADIASSIGMIGTKAQTSTGQVEGLRGGLGKLSAIGPITVGVTVAFSILDTNAYKKAKSWADKALGPLKYVTDNIKQVPRDLNNVVVQQEKLWNRLASDIGLPNKRLDEIFGGSRKLRKATPIVTDVTSGGGYGGVLPGTPTPADVQRIKRTAQQLNAWFDAMVQRQLGRAQYQPLQQQLATFDKVISLLKQRISKTKDATRLLNLNDQLMAVVAQQKSARQQLEQGVVDALQFNVEKAGATKTVTDDIAALRALNAELDKEMATQGKTVDLMRQKFENEQQILQLQQQAEQQRRQAARDAAAAAQATKVKKLQTKLDWAQFALERAQTTKGLKDDIKALKAIIQLIKQQIRTTGLTVDLARQLFEARQQLRDALHPKRTSGGGGGGGGFPGDVIPAGGGAALGFGPVHQAPRGNLTPFGYGGTVYTGDIHVYGVQDVAGFENQLQRRQQQRPQTRRGPV